MPPVIDYDKCTACGVCVDICSEDVFFGTADGEMPLVNHPEVCYHCYLCIRECPSGAMWLRTPMPMMVPYK